jgi:hypothetical protein
MMADPKRTVLPTRVKSRRTQSDSHKHAVSMGKRKARNARDAAKGLRREVHDDDFVPAVGSTREGEAPRLVKRPKNK